MYKVYCDNVLIHDGSSPDNSIHILSPNLEIADSVAGSFSFVLPTTNIAYDTIELFSSTIVIEKNDEKIWIGRPISKQLDFYNQISYSCEGALAFLNDSIQVPDTLMHYDPALFIYKCLSVHNSKVDATRRIYPGTINVVDYDDAYIYEADYVTTWNAIKTNCLDRLIGHMRIRYRKSDSRMYLDYVSEYFIDGNASKQEINFGNNLLTFTRDFNITDVVTAVIPLGKQIEIESEETTDESEESEESNDLDDNTDSTESSVTTVDELQKEYVTVASVNDGSIYVINVEAMNTYGRVEQVVHFSDVEEPLDLLRLANLYLSELQFSEMNLEIHALDMNYLTKTEISFELLDIVHCISAPHGLNGWFPITKISIPIDHPENTIYYLGYRTGSQSTMSGKSSESRSDITREIAAAEKSAVIKTEVMLADYAHITDGIIDNARIGYADVDDLEANYAHIVDGVIDNAKIDHADVNDLAANYAHVHAGLIDNAYISYEKVQDLNANYAHVTNGTIDNAKIDQADVNDLEANYAHITDGVIDNAQIGHADVVDLDANYAHITRGVIDNASIGYANVNELDTHYAKVDISNVTNSWINRGTIKDASISDAMISGVSANKLTAGEINAGIIRVYNLNADNITVGKINGQLVREGTLSLSSLDEDVYTAEEIEAIVADLNNRIDGAIDTYTGTVVPTLVNYPASDWDTDAKKDQHVGDVYYVADSGTEQDGYSYRFSKINNVYSWVLIRDSAVTEALSRITNAEKQIVAIQQFNNNIQIWSTNTESSIGDIIHNYTDLITATNKSLVSSTQVWINSDSEVLPSKPEQPVLNGQFLTDSSGQDILDSDDNPILAQYWYITIPEYDETKPYYYYCYEYQYLDGTYGWSDVVYDRGLSETYKQNRGIEATIQLWTVRDTDSLPDVPTDTSKTGAGTYYEFLTDSESNNVLDSTSKPIAMRTKWDVFIPIYNPATPYYFYCYEYQYNDGTYGWSDPILDTATSELQSKTDLVMTELETRITSNTFNELKHDVSENSATITTLTETTETALDQSVEYIIGTQTGSTGLWTGLTRDSSLKVGKSIAYKLPYAGSGNATLRLTLRDGTTTEAIPVYINDSRVDTQFEANSVINLTYDGTNWRATGYWTDDTYNRTRYQSNITAATAINGGRIICGTDAGYKNIGAGVSFNLSHPLLYSRDNIPLNSTGDNNDLMASDIQYSSNGTIQNGSKDKVIYLRGTVNGNTFTIANSNYLTTVVPTSDDGYYYIPLGVMSSATNGSFSSTNQLLAYSDNAFQQATVMSKTTSNTVNTVKQTADTNSATIRNITTRIGTNADGTASQTDIVSKYSQLQQDLDGFIFDVDQTYYTKTDADLLSERVTQNTTQLEITSAGLSAKANSSDVYTKQQTDSLMTTEVNNRNSALQVLRTGIFADVDATYVSRVDFNNIYINGRNLLKYTKEFTGIDLVDSIGAPILDSNGDLIGKEMNGSLDYAEAVRIDEPNDENFYIRELDNTSKSSSQYSEFVRYKDVIVPVKDQSYYFSFWAKGSGTITAYFLPSKTNENIIATTSQSVTRISADGMVDITLSNTWTKYWVKWKFTDDSSPSNTYRNVLLRLFGGNKASVYGLKFEQNNKVTDWSAAPEDYDIYMQNISDLYERVERNEHKMEVTENTFISKINESIVINRGYVDEVISTEVARRSSEISQTSTNILAKVSETYTTKGDFNNLRIGGRNYLRNTQKFTGNGFVDSDSQDILDSNGMVIGSSDDRFVTSGVSIFDELKYRDLAVRYLDNTSSPGSTYKDFVKFSNVIIPKVGEYYCLGFYAKGSGLIQVQFPADITAAKFNITNSQDAEINDSVNGACDIQLSADWNRYWVRWFCTEITDEAYRHVLLRLYGGNKAYICGMKLEIGSKATDWTAAPEDSENYTEDYIRKIGDAIVESTEAYINITSDNIMSVVSAKTDKGEIISTINQSPEAIAISANRIDIAGNAVFKSLREKVDTVESDVGDLSRDKADAESTVADTQYIYISRISGTNSVLPPSGWISNDSGNQNIWTNIRPEYSSDYPVLFIAKQTKFVNGDIECSTPTKDQTTTVIDGGRIITGSIDATKIAANTITVGSLKDGASYTQKKDSVTASQIIYYSDNTGTVNPPDSWVTSSADATGIWTLVRPTSRNGYTINVAQQLKYANGNLECSDILVDPIDQQFAKNTDAVKRSQLIYYSTTGNIIPDPPNTWVTGMGSWKQIRPIQSSNNKIYVAQQTQYANGDISCSTPRLDDSYANFSFKSSTATSTQRIYKSFTSYLGKNLPDAEWPTDWVNNESGNQNVWTNVRPVYSSNYPYLYTGIQAMYNDGTVFTNTISRDDTTTVIDGGHIITHSITANQLDTTQIRVSNFADGQDYATKRGTVQDVQYIYYRTTSLMSPDLPNTWVSYSSAENNRWTTYIFPLSDSYSVYQAMQTIYGNGVVDTVMMGLDKVSSAIKNISSISGVQTVYANFSSGTTASGVKNYYMPSGWVTNTSKTSSNGTWTTSRPQYNSYYPVTFMITQIRESDGTITNSDPAFDETTTVIDGGHITTGTIDASRIAAGSITADKIASNSIDSSKIKAGSIDTRELAAGAVTADKIYGDIVKAGSITSDKIASGAITSDKIAAHAITASEITTSTLRGLKFGGVIIEHANKTASGQSLTYGFFIPGSGYNVECEYYNGWLVNQNDWYSDVYFSGTLNPEGCTIYVENGVIT